MTEVVRFHAGRRLAFYWMYQIVLGKQSDVWSIQQLVWDGAPAQISYDFEEYGIEEIIYEVIVPEQEEVALYFLEDDVLGCACHVRRSESTGKWHILSIIYEDDRGNDRRLYAEGDQDAGDWKLLEDENYLEDLRPHAPVF